MSEAIERWALIAGLKNADWSRWGLGFDPTSNGFAAFPGLFHRQARRFAWMEAVERHCVFGWWEGYYGADFEEVMARDGHRPIHGLRIRAPFAECVLVVFSEIDGGGYCYGTAAGATAQDAFKHALIEMCRHEHAIMGWLSRGAITGELRRQERRAVFFASPKGRELFDERVKASAGLSLGEKRGPPDRVVDGPVCGPWTRYAFVWRVLFRPFSAEILGQNDNYFFW